MGEFLKKRDEHGRFLTNGTATTLERPDEAERTLHQIAVDKMIQQLDAAYISIQQRLKATLIRAREMTFPPEKQARTAARIEEFGRTGIALAVAYDVQTFGTEQAKFYRDLTTDLAIPERKPSFAENLAAHHDAMRELGWSSLEIERLKLFADPASNDRVLSYTVNEINLESRTVSRLQIREMRPAWQPEEEWRSTREYLGMAAAHSKAVEAERERGAQNVVRHSTGPARIIGTVAK